eukprot:Polyplicarium_translucidae@DN3084_c0_g1_i2.p2
MDRDFNVDLDGIIHSVSLIPHDDTGMFFNYAQSSDQGRTWQTTHGEDITLPNGGPDFPDRIAEWHTGEGDNIDDIGSQAIAQLPTGAPEDKLAFINKAKKLQIYKPGTEDGEWEIVESDKFPDVVDGVHNFVYYDEIGVPTMIGAKGMYRFTSAEDVEFSPLPYGRLIVEAQYYQRTGKILALATEAGSADLNIVLITKGDETLPVTIGRGRPEDQFLNNRVLSEVEDSSGADATTEVPPRVVTKPAPPPIVTGPQPPGSTIPVPPGETVPVPPPSTPEPKLAPFPHPAPPIAVPSGQ